MRVDRQYKAILKVMVNGLMVVLSFTMIFPIIWILYSSFKTTKEFALSIISLPSQIHLINYLNVFTKTQMLVYFTNSFFISTIAVVLILGIGFVTGYLLARYSFKGRNIIYVLFLFGMIVPVHGLLIPLFIQFKLIGLLDKRITLLFPYVAFGLPLAIFLIESFIRTIPIEIDEAAYIDGSSVYRTMAQIIFPICRPVIATVIILAFLNAWNEFPFALVLLKSEKLKTVPIGLASFSGMYNANYPGMMAALVIAIAPIIIIYLFFSKNAKAYFDDKTSVTATEMKK
jgi:raffinose/stachyose/melibiose transport system permease protein